LGARIFNEKALVDTYRWYLENYEEGKDVTRKDYRVAWDRGLLNILKIFFMKF
jgi:hypothetical protein